MSEAKQFDISKKAVIAAFQAVKENAGSYGADEQTIKEFEEHLNNNGLQGATSARTEGIASPAFNSPLIIAAFICVAICSYRGLLALLLTTISTSSPPSVSYCITITSTV